MNDIKPLYEVKESEFHSGEWNVEVIHDDGSVWVTIFTGDGAEDRAREYAALKNGG